MNTFALLLRCSTIRYIFTLFQKQCFAKKRGFATSKYFSQNMEINKICAAVLDYVGNEGIKVLKQYIYCVRAQQEINQ